MATLALESTRTLLNSKPPLLPHLPRHGSTLDDPRHLLAELTVDDRPPRHQRELLALLDDGCVLYRDLIEALRMMGGVPAKLMGR